jgi:hypothetical protein
MSKLLDPMPGELWLNKRRNFTYEIVARAFWSDSPDEVKLEDWVCVRNIVSGMHYVRSLESFSGTNRDGHPRFVRIS